MASKYREVSGAPTFTYWNLGRYIINPQHACAARVTVVNPQRAYARGLLQLSHVSVCLCPSAGANLGTGASRRLTEGTSGLSDTSFTIIKRRFLITASLGS